MVEISQSKEDYIKAIRELSLMGEDITKSRIGEYLDVSVPAVTKAVDRLTDGGFVAETESGDIQLTDEGRRIAEKLMLRHNLVEKLLVEVIGVDWYRVHDEAERIEHVISDHVEQKLLELFGEESRCPHGVPIREESLEERRERGMKLLGEFQEGDTVRVEIVLERDREFLEYMDERNVHPGRVFSIKEVGYDGVMTLRSDGEEVHLSREAAGKIWCRPVEASDTDRY